MFRASQGSGGSWSNQLTTAMATSVKFVSFRPSTFGGLHPAPSVTDYAEIHAALDADPSPRLESTPEDLQDKELKILTSYRSALMWLEGGVVIYRNDPKTKGGHGYAGWPPIGTKETVLLNDWTADVEFV